ncbi:MAG: hypothetical protein JW720_13105 [Sedimentisphaerales bacterium]|nr:hypothetical protein [Sedimentisphaerales bacterium]
MTAKEAVTLTGATSRFYPRREAVKIIVSVCGAALAVCVVVIVSAAASSGS